MTFLNKAEMIAAVDNVEPVDLSPILLCSVSCNKKARIVTVRACSGCRLVYPHPIGNFFFVEMSFFNPAPVKGEHIEAPVRKIYHHTHKAAYFQGFFIIICQDGTPCYNIKGRKYRIVECKTNIVYIF